MQTFTFSDGKAFRGVMTKARINREEIRDVVILACSRDDAKIFAEYDRSLRLNEALLRLFTERHPQLTEDQAITKYNSWQPSNEEIEEAAFLIDNRILRSDGIRDILNGDTHVYYSARLTRGNNGMPTFVPFIPKAERELATASGGVSVEAFPEF